MIRKIVVFIILISISLFIFFKILNNEKIEENEITERNPYNSNLLENVEYISKDAKGNEYIVKATKGEIDLNNSNIIFLEEVRSLIKLTNSDIINITSDYGKYNTNNYDTIFSKNVVITYLQNKITGEYLDFSLARNTMIISKNVIFTNEENILKADVIEINIETKDTKIFMYENDKKVNIKNKNYNNGNN